MTREQAVLILKRIAKPHLVEPDATMTDVWWNAVLERCDYEIAKKIAVALAGTKDRMPKPVHFIELLNAELRRPENQPKALPEPAGANTKSVAVATIAKIRKEMGWEKSSDDSGDQNRTDATTG